MVNNSFRQNRTLWLAIVVAFLVVIAFIVSNNVKNNTVTAATGYVTTTVRRGDIETLVNAPGRLNAINEADLSFQVSGVVSSVVAKPGDIVQQGQPLARLDSRDLELNLAATQASLKQAQAKLEAVKTNATSALAAAQANLKQAQRKLTLAQNGNVAPEDIQAAQADYEQAQARYNNLLNKPNQKDIQAAEATVRQAKAKLEQVQAGPNSATVKQAEATLEAAKQNQTKVTSSTNAKKEQARIDQEQAQRNFDNIKASYEKIYKQNRDAEGNPKTNLSQADKDAEAAAYNAYEDAKSKLEKAKNAYADAQTQADAGQREAQAKLSEAQENLENVKAAAQAREKEIAAAQAELDRANAALEKSRQGATKNELDGAQAEINGAKARQDKLKKNQPDPKEIGLAQAEVEKAQTDVTNLSRGPNPADLNSATAAVEEANALNKRAQLRLEQAILAAPFSGVIGTVNLTPGQNINANAVGMTLLDLSALKVDVSVPESEIVKIKAGQMARLSLDVLPSVQDLRGRVKSISAKAIGPANNTLPQYQPTAAALPGQVNPLPSATLPTPIGSGSSYQVTVILDKPTTSSNDPLMRGIKPGMTSNVRLVIERKSDALIVPNQSIKTMGANKIVEVLRQSGQIIVVPINTGIKGEKETEVLEPSLLWTGDQLLLN